MSAAADNAINWLEWGKFAIAVASPFVALGGGVWMFFLKQKSDREDALRQRRQKLYSEYLATISRVEGERLNLTPRDIGIAVVQALTPLHEEICLLAPDDVVLASGKLLASHLGNDLAGVPSLGATRDAPKAQVVKYYAVVEKQRDAKLELIAKMRGDTLKGTKIAVALPSLLGAK